MTVTLKELQASSPHQAQGSSVASQDLIGYNRHLTDFDLKLPACARMATVVIGKEVLLEQLNRQGGSHRNLEVGRASIRWITAGGSAALAKSAQPTDLTQCGGMES